MRQTFMANEANIDRKWYVVDAEGQTLGRLSSEIASILRGKHKVTYTHTLIQEITLSSLTLKNLLIR